ncbi:MAG: hypothetical protein RI897_3613 [Verrucomicrobiota bacterium]|jgi:diaminopimelate epimerase
MKFAKYHALGNDYLVMEPDQLVQPINPEHVRRICHRNFGIGSDGILLGPLPSEQAPFGLRIFNPDGSEAEKSGNGLRIFSRYLYDRGLVGESEFAIETPGGLVKSTVMDGGARVKVEMGAVTFQSDRIPVAGSVREVIREKVEVCGRELEFCAASIGNPHCVVPMGAVSEALARELGPVLETHSLFPKRTNVQLLQVLDRSRIRIEIWERGAGYTLASGSSSSAAAAVARRLGLCDKSITVCMPGGEIAIEMDDQYAVLMTGSVTRVGEGVLHEEMLG